MYVEMREIEVRRMPDERQLTSCGCSSSSSGGSERRRPDGWTAVVPCLSLSVREAGKRKKEILRLPLRSPRGITLPAGVCARDDTRGQLSWAPAAVAAVAVRIRGEASERMCRREDRCCWRREATRDQQRLGSSSLDPDSGLPVTCLRPECRVLFRRHRVSE